MTSEDNPKIFISYSWEDKKIAQRLRDELKANRAELWIDYSKIQAGDSLPRRISDALDWCNILLLIWSEASRKSEWVELEWTSALTLKKIIIPCVLDEAKLPTILSNILYIDFRNFEKGFQALVSNLPQIVSKPSSSAIRQPRKPRSKVFISYSHYDSGILDRLQVHLKTFIRESSIDVWDDRKIIPGTKWREDIRKAIDLAKIAILLVSADFLSSDFIMKNELPPLLAAAHEEQTIILSLIVGPRRYKQTESISQYKAMNDPSYPIIAMPRHEREQLYHLTTEYIEVALKRLENNEE